VKQLRNILFLQIFLAALFFVFTEKQALQVSAYPQNPTSEFSQHGLHKPAFLQPETANHVVSHVKPFSFFVARLSDFIETGFTNSILSNISKTFLSQDINRCETVSLLLFPFHYFW
jgi:hypothetical protein